MKFSILHISDLHQNLKDEIPPEVLLETLAIDFERYSRSEPEILRPALCVVSGDIVYGVSPSTKNAAVELQRQYDQAHDFLVGLCNRFFRGERECVVILPGNHDVDYTEVIGSGSFLPIPKSGSSKSALVSELFSANSALRWSWAKLSFFRLGDEAAYNNRLRQFARLYEKFYRGERTYSLDPAQQFDVFDFPDLKFCLAALNSCHRNDPMNRVGAIHPSALAAACRMLRSPARDGWCLGASWHHDVAGGAGHEDFLDSSFVQLLIEAGVTVGFHGHRHRSDCFDQKSRLGDAPRKMTIVAAGTLCAGPTNLSPGIPRGYNIVELNTDTFGGRVHSRQMVNQLQNLPIWGPGLFVDTSKSFIDFDLSPPAKARSASLDIQLSLEKASDLFGRQKWKEVIDELEAIVDHPQARRFYVQALQELGDHTLTMERLRTPRDATEAVILGAAILESNAQKEALRFLSLDELTVQPDASLDEIKRHLTRRFVK
ncbi:metallophosphoesterase family protein [Rhizobium leguminosarum]|uniref:metallophosphoesterase family protein n=1 Tax=Rhizobium leguminosarum TaxID=384 RepID=UPI003F94EC25